MSKWDLETCIRYRSQHASKYENLSLGISRTLMERARNSREAILFGRKGMDPALSSIESVMKSRTESVIIVPAVHEDKLQGVVYLSSSLVDAFDKHHLQLAAAAARILGSTACSLPRR